MPTARGGTARRSPHLIWALTNAVSLHPQWVQPVTGAVALILLLLRRTPIQLKGSMLPRGGPRDDAKVSTVSPNAGAGPLVRSPCSEGI
jgi:hypothetical protein